MRYQHTDTNGNQLNLPLGKIVCVGRNYVAHAKELNNAVPDEPLLFLKPATAFSPFEFDINSSEASYPLHYELEIAVLIKNTLKNATSEEAEAAICGIGLALDLTYRDLQKALKDKGYPWEKAKAFDASCPTSQFYTGDIKAFNELEITLEINSQLRQHGKTTDMIVDIISLVQYSSCHFTLLPGDIVLTGTPAGVGVLSKGDTLTGKLDDYFMVTTSVK
ncbi:fumarylacetoacetate hydrolase family protein [Parashewanella spongiae]|uniref:Fumarylacetoacetate hydrolase family protein n=1 Tax=Parashewanella spongiae TaxID=342950 RepID=A0A3A6UIB3_9GAMM|nr:fumarylacetoacetate hydrolase family protein [Parashewanella spongiae]MCL1080335.1 fumarylacetoacetate hydrolase family protein [Parashewanella spongiae]RJY18802.1 fumarylacetoacetate hydrolase family protein [Parashewanella spongiae]